MMEKQYLQQVFEAAKKAVEEGDEDRCVDALCRLKDFQISDVHILASSMVSKGVCSLTFHSSRKIKILVHDIITIWKSFLYNQGKTFKKADNRVQIPIPKTGNPIRDKIRQQIVDALNLVFKEAKKNRTIRRYDAVEVGVGVECALFREWRLCNNGFRNKCRSFLFNIKDPTNPVFRRKILVGEIKAKQVGKLSASEMASDKKKMENEEIRERYLNKRIVHRNDEDDKVFGLIIYKNGRKSS